MRIPHLIKRHYTAAELVARADELSPRMLDVTSPVYVVDDSGKPSAWGSAVFLEIGHIRFAISAAHVFDRRHSSSLYVHARDVIVALSGRFTRLSRASSSPEDDPIDISIVRLHEQVANGLDEAAFLRWHEIDHTGAIPSRDHYLVLGFPISKQRNSLQGNNIFAPAFRFGAKECPVSAYRSSGHDARGSLMLGFDKRRMWDERSQVTAPDLNGMSGCGVWRAGPHLMRTTVQPKLAAILVEWHHRAVPKHVLATRIRPILGAIGSEHQDAAQVMKLLH